MTETVNFIDLTGQEVHKKKNGLESPADLQWSRGSKNTRSFGTPNGETNQHQLGTQECDTPNSQNGPPKGETTPLGINDINNSGNLFRQKKMVNVPRFLLIEREDKVNFNKVSPFSISKWLNGLVGNLKNIKKVKEGLLVETTSANQASRLLTVSKIGNYKVKVLPYKSLNISKGIVFCHDLLNCSLEELLEELKDEGVLDIKRIKTKKNGLLVDSPNHIFTFNNYILPNKVKVAFYVLPVRPYIPNPIQCYRCYRFGHFSNSCNHEEMCICGNFKHDNTPCNDIFVCINCGGNHSPRAKSCPIMKEEIQIQNIKVTEKISYIEAKRKVAIVSNNVNTYAQVASGDHIMNKLNEMIPIITKSIVDQISLELNRSVEVPIIDHKPSTPKIDLFSEDSIRSVISLSSPLVKTPISNNKPSTSKINSSNINSIESTSLSSPSRKKRVTTINRNYVDNSFDSDESILTTQTDDEIKFKKKKGWPKGKPRKCHENSISNKTV